MPIIIAILLLFLTFWSDATQSIPLNEEYPNAVEGKKRLAISFDDGSTRDMPGYSGEDWNRMILEHLHDHEARAILFATGGPLNTAKGRDLLESWKEAEQWLGNHTYTHPSFNDSTVSLEDYKKDFLQNKNFLSKYANFVPYFRFPYLREGDTMEKRDGFRSFLEEQGFKNGHVTIDGEDWYIFSRLIGKLKASPKMDLAGYRELYVQHHLDRARFNDSLAVVLTGRQIDHVLLLHHNLAAALFLGDLLEALETEGWEIIDVMEAYKDPIYDHAPKTLPAGGNYLRALSKEAGIYGGLFRFEVENEGYLKRKMDALGL
ncbi:polysaccharide deacetylase [Cyclobacteriaceae bacterium YHN15]|jgi:peptidoglycan-N-acetylglucosamine deacetylase|nr:polysaccharide deacetylase [Cyclobacteriaceae bacterium YHN15]